MVMFTLLRMVLFYAFYVFIALELLHQLHQFVYIWRIYAENKTNKYKPSESELQKEFT